MEIDIQEFYESILSDHWHKIYQLKELKETNKTNSESRLKSITDRSKELAIIESKKYAMELLFSEDLIIPDWYNERIKDYE